MRKDHLGVDILLIVLLHHHPDPSMHPKLLWRCLPKTRKIRTPSSKRQGSDYTGLVERRGFEPLTSTMRTLRATKVSVLYPRSTHQCFKPANQERLIKDYTILKAIRTAPCSEKRQMTIPDVSCIPIKEPIDCFQAKRLFRTGSSQTFTLSLPSSASACLKSSNVRKK